MTGLEILYAECPEFRAQAVKAAAEWTGTNSPEFAEEWLERAWTPSWMKEEQDWINERGLCE